MLCPKENCIYDSYIKTGEHVCAFHACIYATSRELALEAFLIIKQHNLTPKDKTRLKWLKQAYVEAVESG